MITRSSYVHWSACLLLFVFWLSSPLPAQESAIDSTYKELNKKGISAYQEGNYELAIQYLERALKLSETNIRDYTIHLENLALVFVAAGRMEDAEKPLLQSNSFKKAFFDKNAYGESCRMICDFYVQRGNYPKALTYCALHSQTIKELYGENHLEYAESLNNLAKLNYELSNYEEAISQLQQALALVRDSLGREHPYYSASLNNLAQTFNDINHLDEAEKTFLELVEVDQKLFGTDHPHFAMTLNGLASVYTNLGHIEKSGNLLVQAHVILVNSTSDDPLDLAYVKNNLGLLFIKINKLEAAKKMLSESLHIVQENAPHDPIYGTLLNNLGFLEQHLGNWDESIQYYQESLAVTAHKLGSQHPTYGYTLNNIGLLLFDQNKFENAEKFLKESLLNFESNYDPNHVNIATSLFNLGLLYHVTGRVDETIVLYRRMMSIVLNQVRNVFPSLSEKEKQVFIASKMETLNAFQSFVVANYANHPELVDELYNVILTTRGILYNTTRSIRENIANSRDDELISLYDRWSDLRKTIAELYSTPFPVQQSYLDSMETESNRLEKVISAKSVAFQQSINTKTITWEMVKEHLKADEAAVEIVRLVHYDRFPTDSVIYAALIVKKSSKNAPELVIIPNGYALEKKHFSEYSNSIKYTLENDQLYDLFWKPIQDHLMGIRTVYLSNDGIYHSMNLNALRNPRTKAYILDETALILVGSTRDLVSEKSTPESNRITYMFGYPDYNTSLDTNRNSYAEVLPSDTSSRFFDGENIEPLPGTKQEIQTLSELLTAAEIPNQTFIDKMATEDQLKSISKPKILHIATHGYFLKDHVVANPNARIMGMETAKLIENPLLRSGLLLTGAKNAIHQGGSGVLTAYEANQLNLENTELVVLSACETGLGTILNGEGVYGLQRAFQMAGARAVIMSLWVVSDQATMEFMILFYRGWLQEGMVMQEAFRKAQISLREKFPEPYYWAPFVLSGN